MSPFTLNLNAQQIVDAACAEADLYRLQVTACSSGARIVDCGVQAAGGLAAGKLLADVCLAGLGDVKLTQGDANLYRGPGVQVRADHPVTACMASQYAGWQVGLDDYFGMGCGRMRDGYGGEGVFQELDCPEQTTVAVGVLETSQLPTADVCRYVAERCQVECDQLTLLVARTASLAGGVQVVSRSVETALHKLHEIGFDLAQVVAGFGTAPLPPVAANDIVAIGRTNDAVLYGGHVTLWVRCDDAVIDAVGPRVPSSSSSDFGEPFMDIFHRYDKAFYKIDPLLFSPAVVSFVNLQTGSSFQYGQWRPDILKRSFET